MCRHEQTTAPSIPIYMNSPTRHEAIGRKSDRHRSYQATVGVYLHYSNGIYITNVSKWNKNITKTAECYNRNNVSFLLALSHSELIIGIVFNLIETLLQHNWNNFSKSMVWTKSNANTNIVLLYCTLISLTLWLIKTNSYNRFYSNK